MEARTQGCFQVKIFFSCDQVVQDVGSQCSNTEGLDGSTSPIIQRKLELDKVCASECVFDQHIYLKGFSLCSCCIFSICPKSDINFFFCPFLQVCLVLTIYIYFFVYCCVPWFYTSYFMPASNTTISSPSMTQLFLWLLVSSNE